MIKNIVLATTFSLCYTTLSLACPQALPTQDPSFCQSFKIAAECHCLSYGLPQKKCSNMQNIYQRMIAVYQNLQRACEWQSDTSPQQCIDSWNCYRLGGTDSHGALCQSTGLPCE